MFKLFRTALLSLIALAAIPALATPPVGYVQLSGSHLQDSNGVPVANATIKFSPVNNAGIPISFQVNGSGQATTRPILAIVTSGAFTVQLADPTLTNPANVCFAVTATDNVSGKSLLGPGYSCVQPAGSGIAVTSGWCTAASGSVGGSCNFDLYVPNMAALAAVQMGPTGPAGPPGAGSIAGLSSDGASGINVTAKVSASAVAAGTTALFGDGAGSVNVKAMGAIGNGTTDDTNALLAAETKALSLNATIYVPPGTYLIGNPLSGPYTSGQSVFNLSSGESWSFDPAAKFIVGSSAGITVFNCGASGSGKSNITIVGAAVSATGANQHTYTGLSGSCINSHIQLAAYYPNIGMALNFAEENVFDFLVYSGATAGVQFTNNSNSNIVNSVNMTGISQSGSIGVSWDADSSANLFNGTEIGYWDIGVSNSGHTNQISVSAWIEANLSIGVQALAGSLTVNCANSANRMSIADGAIVNGGYGGRSPNQPNHRANALNLTAYYPMTEGTGTTLYDWSGNGLNATLVGSTTWVAGPYGSAVSLPSAASFANRISIPAAAISYSSPFTIAVLAKAGATFDTGQPIILQIVDSGGHQINLLAQVNVGQVGYYYNPGSAQGNIFTEPITTGKWSWLFLTFDPTANAGTNINPAWSPNSQIAATSSWPLTGTPTSIYLGGSVSGSTDTFIYGGIAIWQRALNVEEAKAWIEQPSVFAGAKLPAGLVLTALGDMLYQSATGPTHIPGNTSTTTKVLTQTGNGTNSAAPSWQASTLPNTLGCLQGYDTLPCTVYESGIIAETAPAGYTTAFTTAAAGIYRVSGGLTVTTTGGTTCVVTLSSIANEVGEAGSNHGFPLAVANITTESKSGTAWPSRLVNLASSAAVEYSTTDTGTCTSVGWNKWLTVERIQ